MKIIDCFIFYNELDMLLYRLTILNDVVDYFVLCEANKTHVGNDKVLYYNENKHLFEKFNHKIIHLIDNELTIADISKREQWKNENHQRDYLMNGIKKLNLEMNDVIIVADLDEIPDPKLLKNIKDRSLGVKISHLEMDIYFYNLKCLCKEKWYRAKILSYYYLLYYCNSSPQFCRIGAQVNTFVPRAGWHLSYFGTPSFIKNKLENFTHQEYNKPEITSIANIEKKIKESEDLFNNVDYIKIDVKDNTFLPPLYDIYLQNYI